ncbi:MAG: hypothetical protein Q4P15_08425 [Propionibacteriaceae bacterium]|nr:hypothetical protein [Propionibacteriaceae bacterium]
MMNEHPASTHRRRHPALNLIWALPLALIVSYLMLMISTLNWCGIFGCSGAGYGRISDPNVPAALAFLIAAGVVAALPLALIPWSRTRLTRWLVAVVFAALICFLGYVAIGP